MADQGEVNVQVSSGHGFRPALVPLVLALLPGSALAFAVPPQGTTTRVSVSSSGAEGNADSRWISISADGRHVAFTSLSSTFVPGDTNQWEDVFVHDRQTRQTTRVSVDSSGVQGDWTSRMPSISGEGRFVAFESWASNLVPGDTNNAYDIFVHDRQSGQTTRASVDSTGVEGNRESYRPSISADGCCVAFDSSASNLVLGPANGFADIYVHDRVTGQTTRVSVDSSGVEGNNHSSSPKISADGRYVAFTSLATNMVPGDTNDDWDAFLHDRRSGHTRLVSVSSSGVHGNSTSVAWSISADGRCVAFYSAASNLDPRTPGPPGFPPYPFHCFVHDRHSGQTTLVSVDSSGILENSLSYTPSISADGRYIAFPSTSSNLVTGDANGNWDVFLHDRLSGRTSLVSVDSSGVQGNAGSREAVISGDARSLAFASPASNLVPGDTNWLWDVFAHDVACPPPVVYCTGKANSAGCVPRIGYAGAPDAAGTGVFDVTQANHAPGKFGLLFYSTSGSNNAPFQGGFLCAAPPLRRTPGSFSAGTGACGGVHTLDFNARIASGVDPSLAAGRDVWAQWWSRDMPGVTALSDALQFRICP